MFKWPLSQMLGPVCPVCFVSPPPQPHPDSARHAFVVPFPSAKDGDQRAPIVYCSSAMVWKQPSAGAFDICGHINQGCHIACLPSLPPPKSTGSHHLSPSCQSPLPNLNVCVIISSSSDSSLKWIIIFRHLKGGHSVLPKGWICE